MRQSEEALVYHYYYRHNTMIRSHYNAHYYRCPGPPHINKKSCTWRTLPQLIRKVPGNSWPPSLLLILTCRMCRDYAQEASSVTASSILQPSPPQLRSPWQATKPSSTDESLATLFSLEGRLQVHSKARCLPGKPQLRGAWLNYVLRGPCLKRIRLDELLRGRFLIHCAWRVVTYCLAAPLVLD